MANAIGKAIVPRELATFTNVKRPHTTLQWKPIPKGNAPEIIPQEPISTSNKVVVSAQIKEPQHVVLEGPISLGKKITCTTNIEEIEGIEPQEPIYLNKKKGAHLAKSHVKVMGVVPQKPTPLPASIKIVEMLPRPMVL